MGWKRILLITASAVGGFLALIIVALFTLDLGRFKNMIADYASDYLGRELSFDGDLSINLGAQTRVVANRIRLASTDWTESPELLTVRYAAVTLDTWSLLGETILVEDVDIEGVRVTLVENAAGDDNYSLPAFEEEGEDSTIGVFLTRGSVADLTMSFERPSFNQPLKFTASSIQASQRDDDHLELTLDGFLNETIVSIRGSVGTMTDLMEMADVSFEVVGSIGEISLEGAGQIDDLAQPRRPALSIRIEGPSARYLTDILGMEPVTSGPLRFEATFEPAAENLSVNVEGVYGEFNVETAATLMELQVFDDLTLTARAAGPSLATLGRLAGSDDFPELPYTVELDIVLVNGALSLERVHLAAGEATLQVNAQMPEFPSIVGATAGLALRGPRFGNFNKLLGLPGTLTGPIEVTANLVQSEHHGVLETQLVADAISAGLSAIISNDEALTGTTASITAGGGDLAVLTTALGIEGVPNLPWSTQADMTVVEEGLMIEPGQITLGTDAIVVEGIVGRDPLSTVTRLKLASTLGDLPTTLMPFDVDPLMIPEAPLAVSATVARAEDAFVLEGLEAKLGDAQLSIDGQVGDALDPDVMHFNVELSGSEPASLLPADLGPFPKGPYRVAARVGFDAGSINLSDVQAELAGTTAGLSLETPLAAPFSTGSLMFDVEGESLLRALPQAADVLPEDSSFSIRGGADWGPEAISLHDVGIQAGSAAAQLLGRIALPPVSGESTLALTSTMSSLQNVQFLVERALPDLPFAFRGTFNGNPDRLALSIEEIVLGRTNLTGAVVVQPASEARSIPAIDVQLRSPLIDLASIEELFEEPAEASDAQDPDRVIPDLPIPAEELAALNAVVDVHAEKIILPLRTLTNAVLIASLQDSALNVEQFNVTAIHGTVGGNIHLRPVGNGFDLRLRVDGTDLDLGLPAATSEAMELLPKYDLTIKLDSTGATLREHAGSLTGYFKVVSGEGDLDLTALRILARDFTSQLFNTVNPFAEQQKYSHLRCMAVLVEARDGILFGDPAMVMRTDKLNIAGVARIDLTTEKLNATFNTRAMSGLGISVSDIVSPYTEVGGTLANPILQLNSRNALFQGSATLATGGLSFLVRKVGERLLGEKNACRKAVSEAEEDILERGL